MGYFDRPVKELRALHAEEGAGGEPGVVVAGQVGGVVVDQVEGEDLFDDEVPVVVDGGHVVAALEPDVLDGAGHLADHIFTLARTDRRDRNYQAPLLATVEDKDYSASPFNVFNSREERMFRRRLLTTVVDLRNVS